MKHLYWFVAAPLMILAVLFATSNMDLIEVRLWPLPGSETVPLYLFAFGVFAIGFFSGGLVAWIGAGRTRSRARAAERLVREEEREIADLKRKLDATEKAETAQSRALVAATPK